MPALHGIDVSHHNLLNQGPIDWNAVATTSPSLEFVIARMSHGGHSHDDRCASTVRRRTTATGCVPPSPTRRSASTTSSACRRRPPRRSCFRSLVGDLQPDEFVMLDVEPDDAAGVSALPIEHIVATLEAIERRSAGRR